jgi:DNA gyrase/topoisomerase IV subunit B
MESTNVQYDEDSIRSLDWKEHIRLRPGCTLGNWEMVRRLMMEYMCL